jgi:hypothetical protein
VASETSKWAGDEESGRPISPSEPSPIVKATPAAPPTLSNATNKGPRQEVDAANILVSVRPRIPSHRKRVAEESERAKKKVKVLVLHSFEFVCSNLLNCGRAVSNLD